ncbi:hypothetical protein F5I97DRAFT_1958716 [Phlebopus sp. FC_14]|nr:hypothetical protein F5I97DRAFT_1958716 [Phlebopus sp. FC_14]
MAEARATFSTSLSFSGTTSASASRSLKRRLSSSGDVSFFTPSSSSFNPKPYAPNGIATLGPNAPKLPPPVRHCVSSLAQHIPVTDPSPSDPNVVFIHPPFVDFPEAHLYPEGLSYTLMAVNPEWFLDQNDFISSVTTKPDAIPYPPQLEPPRGWCPAKKKDLKALGPDGWPEGEEPRLRCTFCRRTYAGVNAKSMWRRHVYEKHKIAMSNRRDGNDRTRGGRGSGREHRYQTSDKENVSDGSCRGNKPSSEHGTNKSKQKPQLFQPEGSSGNMTSNLLDCEEMATPSAPLLEQTEFPSAGPVDQGRSHIHADDELIAVQESMTNVTSVPDHGMSASPGAKQFCIPMSPYDPSLTPSFRHSPPRLPSDQPWRFPSPSHPLHSKARELCLSMLVRGGISPVIKGASTIDSSSPSMGPPSIINTPCSATGSGQTVGELCSALGSSPVVFRPSPRQLFPDNQSPIGFKRLDYRKCVNDSPLSGGIRRRTHHRKSLMNSSLDYQADWPSNQSHWSSASNVEARVAESSNEDPFGGLYKPLLQPGVREETTQRRSPTPLSSPVEESPVLRNARYNMGAPETGLVGLGIGLMAPFKLSTCRTQTEVDQSDADEVEQSVTQEASTPTDRSLDLPPFKKRRTSMEETLQ